MTASKLQSPPCPLQTPSPPPSLLLGIEPRAPHTPHKRQPQHPSPSFFFFHFETESHQSPSLASNSLEPSYPLNLYPSYLSLSSHWGDRPEPPGLFCSCPCWGLRMSGYRLWGQRLSNTGSKDWVIFMSLEISVWGYYSPTKTLSVRSHCGLHFTGEVTEEWRAEEIV